MVENACLKCGTNRIIIDEVIQELLHFLSRKNKFCLYISISKLMNMLKRLIDHEPP